MRAEVSCATSAALGATTRIWSISPRGTSSRTALTASGSFQAGRTAATSVVGCEPGEGLGLHAGGRERCDVGNEIGDAGDQDGDLVDQFTWDLVEDVADGFGVVPGEEDQGDVHCGTC
jgi:hypothetical protein